MGEREDKGRWFYNWVIGKEIEDVGRGDVGRSIRLKGIWDSN